MDVAPQAIAGTAGKPSHAQGPRANPGTPNRFWL
jgi:hypothetical protein